MSCLSLYPSLSLTPPHIVLGVKKMLKYVQASGGVQWLRNVQILQGRPPPQEEIHDPGP